MNGDRGILGDGIWLSSDAVVLRVSSKSLVYCEENVRCRSFPSLRILVVDSSRVLGLESSFVADHSGAAIAIVEVVSKLHHATCARVFAASGCDNGLDAFRAP